MGRDMVRWGGASEGCQRGVDEGGVAAKWGPPLSGAQRRRWLSV
jgi:hypothetical protein